MRNLLRFIVRYNFTIIFIIMEAIAIVLILSNSPVQRGRMSANVNAFSSVVYKKAFQITQYMSLRQANEKLAKENANLRVFTADLALDSALVQKDFDFFPALVINNSINKSFNYLTLDKGSNAGIETDMAVVSPFGIVGVVKSVSPDFARVISVLNKQLRISVKLKGSQYFGSMTWNTRNYMEVEVSEIPSHVDVNLGDSIVTSGYSAIFPSGELVARVIEVSAATDGNFLILRAKLTNDFKHLNQVYIVKNKNKKELIELEKLTNEE